MQTTCQLRERQGDPAPRLQQQSYNRFESAAQHFGVNTYLVTSNLEAASFADTASLVSAGGAPTSCSST